MFTKIIGIYLIIGAILLMIFVFSGGKIKEELKENLKESHFILLKNVFYLVILLPFFVVYETVKLIFLEEK